MPYWEIYEIKITFFTIFKVRLCCLFLTGKRVSSAKKWHFSVLTCICTLRARSAHCVCALRLRLCLGAAMSACVVAWCCFAPGELFALRSFTERSVSGCFWLRVRMICSHVCKCVWAWAVSKLPLIWTQVPFNYCNFWRISHTRV